MTAPLVFLDTETTGLSLDDDIWEFAAIRREPDGREMEFHIFIEHDREKCAKLPISFRDDHNERYRDHLAYTPAQAASYIGDIFRNGKPHVVGAVPNFDTERIAQLLTWARVVPGWHYHLIDVENLAVGYLNGRAREDENEDLVLTPPWNSDFIAAALGVTINEADRHTAMGDARWAMRIYDAVMGRGRQSGPLRPFPAVAVSPS